MRLPLGRVVLVLGLIAGAAMLVWSLMPRPVPVETAQVSTGRFVATVDEDGKTRVRERYVVSSPLTGHMSRIRLKVGDPVTAEEVVTSILPSPAPFLDPRVRREAEERLGAAEATRERTRAVVERAQAQAAQAKRDYERTRTLVQRGVSTTQALERDGLALQVAERDLRAADFQDHAAEHELDQAKALLARYHDSPDAPLERWSVKTPVSGVVLKVAQESETIVQPGTPLVEIGDPIDLEIVVDVLSTDAVEIHPGAEVMIERWGGPGVLAGRVRRIEPAAFTKISTLGVEEQRVNVQIDVTSPRESWAGLGDGYRVDARITVFTQDEATLVPTGALFRIGDTWNVYVVTNGRAERRAVAVLRRSGRVTAITSGLTAGDTVIVYPSDRIAPGVRVETR
jgi:HlyD family secretion protein